VVRHFSGGAKERLTRVHRRRGLGSASTIVASIAALLLAMFGPHAARPPEAKGREHAASRGGGTAPAVAPRATPSQSVLVPAASTPRVFRQRRVSKMTVADARTGIVLAAILGPCRAHAPDDDVTH
jgi:hypothetical protein